MSDTLYSSPVDFLLGIVPNQIAKVEPNTKPAIMELHTSLQQVIYTLVEYAGVGTPTQARQNLLVGTYNTIKTGNTNRVYVTAGENLLYGHLITFISSGPDLFAVKASAVDNTKPAY